MRPLWKVGVRSEMGQFWEFRSHTWLPPYITPPPSFPKMAPFSNVTQCKDQVQFERLQFYLWKRSLTVRFLLGCDRNIDKGTVGDGALFTYFKYILPVLREFCEFFTSSSCYVWNIAQGMVEYGAFPHTTKIKFLQFLCEFSHVFISTSYYVSNMNPPPIHFLSVVTHSW